MDNALPTGLLMLRVIPYFLPLTIVLILFAAFPQISLWLPDLVMRPQQRWNAFARTLQRLIGADGVVEQDERESRCPSASRTPWAYSTKPSRFS